MTEQSFKRVDLKPDETDAGSRLDQCLARLLPDYSRVFLKKLILDGLVKINGAECKVPKTQMKAGMEITVDIPEEKKRELIAERIDLEVLYEDNDIIVINKPAGIVVHPAAGNWTGTVVNALLGRDDSFSEDLDEDEMRPGIVHRLDKDTSGCLVIAKTRQSQMKLSKSFAARDVKKVYAAISYGWPQVESERISTRIGRHHVNRKRMAVINELHGKLAVTSYEVMKIGKINDVPVSLLKVKIFTGRTHQIRVHLAYKKLPILGDEVYGGKTRLKLPRQMLHAWKIAFPHPVTGIEMTFTSPFPPDFKAVADKIKEEDLQSSGTMFRYIIKRTFYSALIIAGVMIITFMLFKVAAGDPAATVLGKNPSPSELESLREELGSNKPLFFGKWKKTESFSSYDFTDRRNPAPPKSISGEHVFKNGCLELKNGFLGISRNFKLSGSKLKCEITYKGRFECLGITYSSESWACAVIYPPETIADLSVSANDKKAFIKSVEFFREQKNALDSQLIASLAEIVSFAPDFPFVTFFNFGKTLLSREEIRGILWRGIWPSVFLMVPVFFGELVAGIILALLATAFRGKWVDKAVLLASVAGMSVSYLVFIIYGQWYLGYYYDLFPVWGYGELKYLALPVLIGVVSGTGGGVRFYRTVFVNELNREYLRTAAAKGCSPYSIYYKHLLRNAMIPIITRAAATLPFLFTGSLLLETFFGIPGLGFAGINALMNSDLQMLKALVILSSVLFVVINLLADIAYAWADPRIRLDR